MVGVTIGTDEDAVECVWWGLSGTAARVTWCAVSRTCRTQANDGAFIFHRIPRAEDELP